MEQQGVWHLVPLLAGLDVYVDFAPTVQPEALVEMGLGDVVVVLSAQHFVQPHGVGEADDGGVEVDGTSAQLVVDIGFAGRIAQRGANLRGAHIFTVAMLALHLGGQDRGVECAERHGAAGLVLFCLAVDGGLQTPVGLVFEGQALAIVEHHLVGLRPFQSHHEVILVGVEEAVAGRAYVVGALEGQRAARELVGQVVLLVERVGDLAAVIVLFAAPAVGIVA